DRSPRCPGRWSRPCTAIRAPTKPPPRWVSKKRPMRGAKKPPEGGNQKGGSTPPRELLSCPPLTAAVSRLTAAHSETAEETLRVSAHRSECRQRHSGSGPARRPPLQSEPAPQSERKTTTSLRKTDNRASAHLPRLLPPFAA